MPEPVSIQVGGNVDGSIVVGDNNFVVNTNHGTIVYKQAGPQVRPREFAPQPPRAPRGFINRTAEMTKLEAWISAGEIVLMHAPDGMGKSSLLRQAANSAAAKAMQNGVILLEGVDVNGQALGPDDVIQNLFDALFESDPPLKVDSVSARTYLSNTRPLVLLDEVSLSPALQKTLPDLFPRAAILLTADMAFGDFERLSIGPLPRDEAVNLLAIKADVTLNDANRANLDAICGVLNDVSLAIIITGNVLRETHTSSETALQAIQDIPASGKNPASTALDRAFSFAFSKLGPEEQKILSAAALTPGISMSPEWLAAALGGVEIEAFLERLKALGLLFANSPRLRLPPGFRTPAQRAAVLDEAEILPRLIEFLTAPLRENAQNWEHIRDELGNFFGALTWAVRARRWADVITLGRALDPYLSLHGLWDAWNSALGYILDAARQSGEQSVQAWALHQSGVREIGVGTPKQALEFLKRALEMRRKLGDSAGLAYTQHNIDFLLGLPPPGQDPPKQPSPKPPRKGIPKFAQILVGALLVGTLGFASLRFFFPPAPPQIAEISTDHQTLYYGVGAEDCGPTSATVYVTLSKDDPSVTPVAQFGYAATENVKEWFDLPLKYTGSGTYQGFVQPDHIAMDTLGSSGGRLVIEARVGDGGPSSTSLTLRHLCATPTPVDTFGPLLYPLTADPSPSFYGAGTVECELSSEVTFSVGVKDDSEISSVSLRYRYEINGYFGEWESVPMTETVPDSFAATIDHNERDQATRVLDGADGLIRWEVTAVDELGYESVAEAPLAEIQYARCDTAAPEILRPFATPDETYYGLNVSDCGRSSLVEFYAYVRDESAIERVYLEYRYYVSKALGPMYILDLNLITTDGYYGNIMDNNFQNRAQTTLKMKPGFVRWAIVAIDEFGNTARTKDQVIPIDYYCPAPG